VCVLRNTAEQRIKPIVAFTSFYVCSSSDAFCVYG
jgi:hypothetical protein